ncbi:MAG: ribbon-helix-helix domain-containing protein [Candidatus Nanopelagicales bacterium]
MNDSFEPTARPAGGIWGTVNGVPVTDEVIDDLVKNAESGFPGATFKSVGRPRTVGGTPAKTVTERLDPERISAVQERAEREHTSASEIMRRALDQYLAS